MENPQKTNRVEKTGKCDVSQKQESESGKIFKIEEDLVMEVIKVLVLNINKGLISYERRSAIEEIFGKDIQILPVEPVSSVEDLEKLIQNHQKVVMIEAEVVLGSVFAKIILEKLNILEGIQVRESLYCNSRADDKETLLISFRGYGQPITKVRFI